MTHVPFTRVRQSPPLAHIWPAARHRLRIDVVAAVVHRTAVLDAAVWFPVRCAAAHPGASLGLAGGCRVCCRSRHHHGQQPAHRLVRRIGLDTARAFGRGGRPVDTAAAQGTCQSANTAGCHPTAVVGSTDCARNDNSGYGRTCAGLRAASDATIVRRLCRGPPRPLSGHPVDRPVHDLVAAQSSGPAGAGQSADGQCSGIGCCCCCPNSRHRSRNLRVYCHSHPSCSLRSATAGVVRAWP